MNWRRITVAGLLLLCLLLGAVWFFSSQLGVNPPLPRVLSSNSSQTLSHLKVPQGFTLSLFASDLKAPRMLHVTGRGDVLVSLPREGSVRLLRDKDGDGQADESTALLQDLNLPHGIDSHDGWLYVAETDAVGRIAFNAKTGTVRGRYQKILTGLPSGKGHWTRTLRIGPDGWLYVTVGSSCNVCIEKAPERAAMLRMRPDGSDKQLYATGLRNSVGFDWSPVDGEIYATDNGRDWLGDNFPPDELNRIVEGGFYGWPYANGTQVPDPDFGEGQQALVQQSIAPVHGFRAHNAPLGVTFLRHSSLPDQYHQVALVALHGSWNRSTKDGYKVISLHWKEGDDIEERDFITGFVAGDEVFGRPVAIAEAADGALYISDDYAGVIYQLTYKR